MERTITREEMKAKIDREDDFRLVEALPEFLYARVHLPGALNIPPDRVRELAPSLLPDKHTEIVVYCADDG
jgi:rhodanese-related sulfurtransferase